MQLRIGKKRVPVRNPNAHRQCALSLNLIFLALAAPAAIAQPNTGMADATALIAAFDRFLSHSSGDTLTLSLSNLRGLSGEAVNAGGRVMINLTSGSVSSTVTGLPQDGSFDLWLVDNRLSPGHTTFAETGDVSLKVGTYNPASGAHSLSATPGPAAFANFFPDRAFVVRSRQNSPDPFVLTGPSTLFDRLRRRQVHFTDDTQGTIGFDRLPRPQEVRILRSWSRRAGNSFSRRSSTAMDDRAGLVM